MKKIILITFILALFGFASSGFAQVKAIVISVDGFTCSLCAKGVEEQFKALDFISSVKANLESASFDLKFKPGKQLKIEKLWSAVDDGGFTVGSVKVEASGKISKSGSGYVLSTGNSPDLSLTGLLDGINDGDEVNIKGTMNSNYTVMVSSIKKS